MIRRNLNRLELDGRNSKTSRSLLNLSGHRCRSLILIIAGRKNTGRKEIAIPVFTELKVKLLSIGVGNFQPDFRIVDRFKTFIIELGKKFHGFIFEKIHTGTNPEFTFILPDGKILSDFTDQLIK